jgi:hypothetical protein
LVIHSPWSMLWRTMRASMVGSVADLFAFVVTIDYFPPPPRGTIDTRSIVSIHWVEAVPRVSQEAICWYSSGCRITAVDAERIVLSSMVYLIDLVSWRITGFAPCFWIKNGMICSV